MSSHTLFKNSPFSGPPCRVRMFVRIADGNYYHCPVNGNWHFRTVNCPEKLNQCCF